jgi:hypothetical protein
MQPLALSRIDPTDILQPQDRGGCRGNVNFSRYADFSIQIGFFAVPRAGCAIHRNYTKYTKQPPIVTTVAARLTRDMLAWYLRKRKSALWSGTDGL